MSSGGPSPCTPCALACRRAQAAPGWLSVEHSSGVSRLSRRALGPVGPAPVAPGLPVRSSDAVRCLKLSKAVGPRSGRCAPGAAASAFCHPPCRGVARATVAPARGGLSRCLRRPHLPPLPVAALLRGGRARLALERRPWSWPTARAESTTRVPAVPGHAPRQRSSAALRPVVTPHGVVPATGWLSPAPPGPPRVVGGPIARLRERRPHRPPTPGF